MDRTEDIHFPESFAPFLEMQDDLTIILPNDSNGFKTATMDTIFRGVVLDDMDFDDLGETLTQKELPMLSHYYYSVDYIRFTRVRQVTSKEWRWSTYRDERGFCHAWEKDLNSTARVLKLTKESLSLKDFNQYYRPGKLKK